MVARSYILAVDDTPDSLKLLTDILRDEGYEVRSAINGELAIHAAMRHPPGLVLLDIRMPGMDGFEVCRQLKACPETADIPVIFVSAVSETDEKVQGFAMGAVDFVTKPYQRSELLARVRTHLELTRLRNSLEQIVEERSNKLLESEKKLRTSLLDSIMAIASMVEMRDPYTAGHQRRVAQIAVAIAKQLQLPDNQIEGIHLAAIVHDVGKIKVPAEILCKPGSLTVNEYNLIKEHPQTGYDILKSIDYPWAIADIVLQHHERLNGSGYPNGLIGDEILLEAQIIAVADVVESMMSHRPYRAGLGLDRGLAEITSKKDSFFNSDVVDVCLKLFLEQHFKTSQ